MKVKSKLKKSLEINGYVRVRNVLNFTKDLKPILRYGVCDGLAN